MSKKYKAIKAQLKAQQSLAVNPANDPSLAVDYGNLDFGNYDPNTGSFGVPQQAEAPPVYSQPVQDFIDQMMAYETEQQGAGYVLGLKDKNITAGMAEGDWQKLIDSKANVADLYALGHEFKTNKGNAAGTVFADPTTQYRLRNERGKDFIVAEGTGLEALDNIYREATNLSTTQRKKANWDVEMLNPESGQWELVAKDEPAKPLGKKLLKVAAIAAPIAGALLIPGLGLGIGAALTGALGSAGAAGVGAALGSMAVGTLQGKKFGKILKGGLISGVGAAAGAGLLGGTFGSVGRGISSALGGVPGGAAGSTLGSAAGAGAGAAGAGAGEIIITGSRLGLPALIGSAALGGLAGSAATGGFSGAQQPNTLQSQQPTQPASQEPWTGPVGEGPPVEIVGNLPTGIPPASIGAGAGALVPAVPGGATTDPNEIVITGKNEPPFALPPLSTAVGAPTGEQLAKQIEEALKTDPEAKNPDTLDKILKYVEAGFTGFGILGNLFAGGGKGDNAAGKIPAGFWGAGGGQPSGVMGPNLPGANLPNVGMPGGPRQMPQQDWNLYGTRPEQSFWNDIPQSYVPPPPGGEDIWSQQARGFPGFPGFARGGEVDPYGGGALPVVGPGSGTSDDIPAMLSDGEYVVDAATVRAMGNGSREKGFAKLDRMRRQVKRNKRPKRRAPRSLGVMYAAQ